MLAEKDDVDTPEDLAASSLARAADRPWVSVVIPALDDAASVGRAVVSARRDGAEVIVVDGGSSDDTARLAESAGATVIESPRGRGRQMSRGAAAATGEALLFLHADTLLPAGYVRGVFDALMDPGVVGGAFGSATDTDGPAMRVSERLERIAVSCSVARRVP